MNLSYTTITAPLDGRIGKSIISEGNYVTSSSGPLTTIYQTSPMRVNFAVKSSEYIKIKKYFNENKDGKKLEDIIDVKLKLADGSVYDKIGKLEFSDNKIDEEMGTVAFRALFDNPAEILMPGDYVNVILVVKKPEKVMLIPQSATKTDVGTGYYVWAIKDGKAVKKDIVVNYNINNNWIVEKGLEPTDKIVVKGIQDIYKTGQPVKATETIIDANVAKDDVKTEAKGANNDK
ncbi:MAG: efflux RND transporter periplasmic adaptor subunit [bacterium]|nr:efflux RND transporter periplasmic adaptor subunit [bacterium]